MAIEAANAALRITHATRAAAEVTRALGVEPSEVHEVGERRSGRSDARWEHSFWRLGSGLPEDSSLAAHLRLLADLSLPLRSELEDLAVAGYEMTWACFVSELDGQGGVTLDAVLMRDLGSLPVGLWLDIYAE